MTPENIEKLAARLGAIYARVRDLEGAGNDLAAARSAERLPTPFSPAVAIPTRIEAVRTARGGLEYAVWTLGEAVALADGMDALDAIYAAFEAKHDDRVAIWLDRRWNGISDGSAIWTC